MSLFLGNKFGMEQGRVKDLDADQPAVAVEIEDDVAVAFRRYNMKVARKLRQLKPAAMDALLREDEPKND